MEFLEFTARLAEVMFKGTEDESLELVKKIEYLLDEILPFVGAKREKQKIYIDEFSESDEDYSSNQLNL